MSDKSVFEQLSDEILNFKREPNSYEELSSENLEELSYSLLNQLANIQKELVKRIRNTK